MVYQPIILQQSHNFSGNNHQYQRKRINGSISQLGCFGFRHRLGGTQPRRRSHSSRKGTHFKSGVKMAVGKAFGIVF